MGGREKGMERGREEGDRKAKGIGRSLGPSDFHTW
jgi:hypothetical protein